MDFILFRGSWLSCCHGLAVSTGQPAHVHVFLCVLFLTSLPPASSPMCLCVFHHASLWASSGGGVSRAEASHTCCPSTSPAAADHLRQWPLLNWVDEFQSTLDRWDIELVKPRVWPEILLSCISWIGHWPSRLVLAGFGEECATGAERLWNRVLELFACHGPRAGSRSREHVHRSHVIQIGSKHFAAAAQLTSFSDGGDRTQCLPQIAVEFLGWKISWTRAAARHS